MPFIAVLDDHEFANNAYVAGAENHDSVTQGDWASRKANAAGPKMTTLAGQTVGHESAGTSVSSPGFESLGLGALGPTLGGSAATCYSPSPPMQ